MSYRLIKNMDTQTVHLQSQTNDELTICGFEWTDSSCDTMRIAQHLNDKFKVDCSFCLLEAKNCVNYLTRKVDKKRKAKS